MVTIMIINYTGLVLQFSSVVCAMTTKKQIHCKYRSWDPFRKLRFSIFNSSIYFILASPNTLVSQGCVGAVVCLVLEIERTTLFGRRARGLNVSKMLKNIINCKTPQHFCSLFIAYNHKPTYTGVVRCR